MFENSLASGSSAGLFIAAHSRSSRRWLMVVVELHGVNVCPSSTHVSGPVNRLGCDCGVMISDGLTAVVFHSRLLLLPRYVADASHRPPICCCIPPFHVCT